MVQGELDSTLPARMRLLTLMVSAMVIMRRSGLSGDSYWFNARLPNSDDPVYTVVGVGSNGFPGYSPAFSDEYNRDSTAFYGELGVDLTDDFFVQAVRYEDYSDFGAETVYKIAAKYSLTDSFGVRGL